MPKERAPKRPKGRKTPQQRRRQGRIITVIIGVLAILSMVALLMLPRMTQTDTTPMVATQEVQKGDVTAYLEVSGTVKSLKTKTYYSPVNAAVKEYAAKAGQAVTVGTTLVSFDTSTLERDNPKASYTRSVTVNTNQDVLDKAAKSRAEADVARGNTRIIQSDIDRFKNYINGLKQAISDRTIQLSQQATVSAAVLRQDQVLETEALSRALEAATQIESLKARDTTYQAEIDSLTISKSQAEFEGDKNTAATIGAQIKNKTKTIEADQILIDQLEEQMGDYAGLPAADIQQMLEGMSAADGSVMDLDTGNAATDAQLAQWQLDLENAQTTLGSRARAASTSMTPS